MFSRRSLVLLLPGLTLSCIVPPSIPPLPATARTIAAPKVAEELFTP